MNSSLEESRQNVDQTSLVTRIYITFDQSLVNLTTIVSNVKLNLVTIDMILVKCDKNPVRSYFTQESSQKDQAFLHFQQSIDVCRNPSADDHFYPHQYDVCLYFCYDVFYVLPNHVEHLRINPKVERFFLIYPNILCYCTLLECKISHQ